jgi:hypothetical protein
MKLQQKDTGTSMCITMFPLKEALNTAKHNGNYYVKAFTGLLEV